MQTPASTSLLVNTIDGVLALSSIDKKALTQKLNLAAGSVVDDLGGLSIVGIFGGVLLMVVLCFLKVFRNPKLR